MINQYHDDADEAGRFARRLLREMDSLWVLLAHHGVEPTNNRAERALRFGILWHLGYLRNNRIALRELFERKNCYARLLGIEQTRHRQGKKTEQ